MENTKQLSLLKNNLKIVEEKYTEFFTQRGPRWPGEEHDLLRNHHKNIDNLSIKAITFERLSFSDLPENIMKELADAFDAYNKGIAYK
jgi:hypothetical protein